MGGGGSAKVVAGGLANASAHWPAPALRQIDERDIGYDETCNPGCVGRDSYGDQVAFRGPRACISRLARLNPGA